MFLLLFPVEALANDAGVLYDGGDYIDVSIKVHSTETAIGGNIEFDISIKNISKDTLESIRLFNIFNYYPRGDANIPASTLEPGEKLTAHVIAPVPNYIDWYKNKESYYANLNVKLRNRTALH